MKYDCNKAIDYLHEADRMCRAQKCVNCDLDYENKCHKHYPKQKDVNIVQKWSDEHPEQPKLTKKEREFLECLKYPKNKTIRKSVDGVVFVTCDSILKNGMFDFIEDGESMTVEELLKLEVEK